MLSDRGSDQVISFVRITQYHLLGLLLLTCLATRMIWFVGVGINDDVIYIFNVKMLTDGYNILSHPTNQIGFRLGMVLPLTALYKLFGNSEAAFSSYPIACSLLTCAFIYLTAFLLWGIRAAAIAAIFWIAYPLQIVFDTQLSPSNQHAMLVAGAFFFFFLGREAEKRERHIQYAYYFFSGSCLGLGWMVNELFVIMGVIAIPMIIVFKPRPKAVAMILLGLILMLAIDFIIVKAATGSWLARIYAIINTEKVMSSNKSFDYLPETLFSLFQTDYLTDNGHFGILWHVFILTTIWAFYKKQWITAGLSASVWLVIGYLQWGIMSVDGTPITKYIRYISMIVPIQCLGMGVVFKNWYEADRSKIVMKLLLGLFILHLLYAGITTIERTKFKTDDYRKISRFLSLYQNDHMPIYMDGYTSLFVDIYSSETVNIKRIENLTELTPPQEGLVIIDGSLFVVNNKDYRKKMPPWYFDPPDNWILLGTVKNKPTNSIYDSYDPKIYYIPKPKDTADGKRYDNFFK